MSLLLNLFMTGFYLHVSYIVTYIPLMLIVAVVMFKYWYSLSIGQSCKTAFTSIGLAGLLYIMSGGLVSLILNVFEYSGPSLDHNSYFYVTATFLVALYYGVMAPLVASYTSKGSYYWNAFGLSSLLSAGVVSILYMQLFG